MLPTGDEVLVAARHPPRPRHAARSPGRGEPALGRARARLDRERSDLVATVAHELRSPLTGVKGFVQALLNRWDRLNDEQKKLMLTTVHADSDRLSRLITELLDVARLDTGRLSMHQRPCDVALLTAAGDRQRPRRARRTGSSTSRRTTCPTIWADPDKFTQVLTNLLENAIRHGADPVTRDRAPTRASWSSVQVDDSGDGIAAGDPAARVHEVLDHRAARRLRARALHRQRPGAAPTAARSRSTTPRRAAPGSR